MKLALKKSLTRWVKVGKENEEFYIDYPSIEQEQELDTIKNGDKYSGVDKAIKHAQLYLKYVIKDWKGINDENGHPIKCELTEVLMDGKTNYELEYNLWWSLVKDSNIMIGLFVPFWNELEPTESDKKKLSSQDSSSEKVNSQE